MELVRICSFNHLFFVLLLFGTVSCGKKGQDSKDLPPTQAYPTNDVYEVRIREVGEDDWHSLITHSAKTQQYVPAKMGNAAFVVFDRDFLKPVEIEISKIDEEISDIRIRPSSKRINYVRQGNTVKFTISKPEKLSVEFNGDILNNLMIFANLPELDVPAENDPNVIYFDRGIHDVGEIDITDGQTLYLAEGAIVYGYVRANGANNIAIRGRGILDGGKLNHDVSKKRERLVQFENCDNVEIEGVIMRDSPAWTTTLIGCDGVSIKNIKQICYIVNSDGLDIVNSSNVLIDNVFLRNHDDNISLKVYDGTATKNIVMRNSILWADRAHNMLVGPEARGGKFEDIRFENIDVLENAQNDEVYPGVMAVMVADGGTYKDIEWKDIRVEDFTRGKLICIQYTDAFAEHGLGKKAHNIRFVNIDYVGSNASPSRIFGHDQEQNIEDVSFDNLVINGKKALNKVDGNIEINAFTRNISFQ